MSKIYVYDFEVFSHDWMMCTKDYETGERFRFHNDNEAVKDFLQEHPGVMAGFNNKGYDQFILKGVCGGFTPQELKGLNDFIIGGGNGWEYPELRDVFAFSNQLDVMDDMQMRLSLKAIEGHLGMDIRETTVPFDIDRPLTKEEIEEVFFYCEHDVDATERVLTLRRGYMESKMSVGRMIGLDDVKALYMTNAKLTAAMLGAKRQEHDDERGYSYPENLDKKHIPTEVIEFFDRLHDPNVSDDELFKSKMELKIGECPVTIGFGGIHGAIPNFMWEEEAHAAHTR